MGAGANGRGLWKELARAGSGLDAQRGAPFEIGMGRDIIIRSSQHKADESLFWFHSSFFRNL